ncbi:MAG: ATP-dependent DNA helicase [bacterium]|nr:ATP-dependent DNA helicase [bacterium]
MTDRLLNEEQKAAVTHGDGPLLIIAGAGTGKTTVITERIKHLVLQKNIPPSALLALTFTEKAASEMETRIDQILPYGYTQMWIQTFHGFCDRVLRNEAIHMGLTPSYTLMTEAEALLFLKKNIFAFQLDYFRPLGNPMKFLQGMLQHFSRIKDDDIGPEQYLKFAKQIANGKSQMANGKLNAKRLTLNAEDSDAKKTVELANAFKKYEELKAKKDVMDFSDLISNTLKLFRTRPNILKEYQNKFHYILVDEFQDTNFAQNEMAILLAGDKKNITVVGDDDQSIYRWRGAAIANMMQFKSHFPKAKIITLTKNYRSTQTILDSAYQMIQNNNPDRLEIKEKINKKLTTTREVKGEEVELLFGGNAEEEAELVVKKIKDEMSAKGGSAFGGKNNKRAYSDFAILVRANDHSLPFQRALSHAHIPFQFLGPSHLYEQDEIKDLIAYLRVLANFDDTASLYRLLTLPIFDFDAVTIGTILNTAKRRNTSLFETLNVADSLSLTNEIKEKIKNLIAMIKRHMGKIPKETAGQILYYFFEDSGLLGYYLDPRTPKTEREALNVAKFFERLQHYASEHDDASIYAVVDWIELSMELGESPMTAEVDWTGTNAVNILTIHSSKGLEFPVVFVTNLVTLRFPTRDKKEQIPIPQELIKEELPEGDENLQEERRLFYVAMTRSRDKLFLTAAKFYSGGKRERKISPFVYEVLGETYVNTLLKKQQQESASLQLSLLEVLKPVVSEAEEKQEIHITKNGQSAFIEPITTISYSQLQTFDVCPLHYKLRYIMKLPTAPSAALSFGTSMHALLRTIYALDFHNNPLSPEKINALIDQSFITDGYESREHINDAKKGAKDLLAAFMKENQKEPHLPAETELSFQFLIDNIKIIGRFDRVDKIDDKTIEIIDYKTGRNAPDEKKLKNDLQLTMYALAATEIKNPLFNKTPENVILTLYYIEQNKRLTTTRTKEQLETAKKLILEKVKEIQTSDFHCTGGRLCQDCEYKMLCSTYAH